jgi:NTP pyrophosphatase (non-canonical NTP hydrolase)
MSNKADYFDILVDLARQEAAKAIEKYPQPNYTMLKFSEEAGEVIKGAVHYAEGRDTWVHVEEEIVQTLAMLIRFLREGDGVNKIYPPKDLRDAMRGNRDAC